jgi:hypothetical protein
MYKLVKSPIALGLISGVLTYSYYYYKNEKKSDDDPTKKNKIDLIIPCIVAVVIWFVSSTYFDYAQDIYSDDLNDFDELEPDIPMNVSRKAIFCDNTGRCEEIEFSSNQSYQQLYGGKNMSNLKIPKTDVFIDLATF